MEWLKTVLNVKSDFNIFSHLDICCMSVLFTKMTSVLRTVMPRYYLSISSSPNCKRENVKSFLGQNYQQIIEKVMIFIILQSVSRI